jgi:MFS family permease
VGYLRDVVGLDFFSIGVITGSEVVAMIIARPLFGRISDTVGRVKPALAALATSCLLVAVVPFVNWFPLLVLLVVGYGVSFAAVVSCTTPLVCDLAPPTLVGASMGFLSSMRAVGQTLGPIVSGFIFATNLRYLGMFISLSGLLAVSIVVFLVTKRTQKVVPVTS